VLIDYTAMCAYHVDSVLIAGALVFTGGQFTTLDETAITEELGQIAAAGPPERVRGFHSLMADIRPHVAAFYRDWFDDPLPPFEPFATPNSRR